ncbi:hypothetical protein EYR40_008782 [Pleurotus pulmonarius]|nr:hypothetical protein EYR36_009603 [Pleurotus pulmonarius]KAF4593984.1 hypothetical protein EYR40_008782 [Pleurotus pulmonarius]
MQTRFSNGALSPTSAHGQASVRLQSGSQPRRQGGLVLDGLDGVLNVLRSAGSATQIPYVREAAGVLLQVVNTIQAVRDNQDAFKRLVAHASEILTRLEVVWRDQRSKRVSNELHLSLKRLYDIILDVRVFVDEIVRRNRFKRTICCKSDLVRIQNIKDDLNNCLEYFKVDALIITNQEMVQLMESMTLLQKQFHDGRYLIPTSSHPSPAPSPKLNSPTLDSVDVLDQSMYPNADALAHDEVITQGSEDDYLMSHTRLVPAPERVVYPLEQSTSDAKDQASDGQESAEAPEKTSLKAAEIPPQNEM